MNITNLFKIAYRSLLKNKMRTFLTMLGIIIGVASVIAMLGIGNGSKENIKQQIASLGTNVVIVFPSAQNQGGVRMDAGSSQRLTLEDALAIGERCEAVEAFSPIVQQRGRVVSGSSNAPTSIIGAYPDYFTIRNLQISEGVLFSMSNERTAAKVCVIGQTVVKNIFGEGSNPIGETIRLNNIPFKVIGVMAPKGQNTFGQDQDDVVIAPFSTVRKRMMSSNKTGLQQILISAKSEDLITQTTEEITQLLRERHFTSGPDDKFSIRTQAEFASIMGSTTQIMSILLAAIASISLLVGGIGIMNIMLVSVTERTREIGIRRAVGGKSSDVLLQFLIEAIVISVVGGVIGILSGYGIAGLVGSGLGWPVKVSIDAVLLSFAFSISIGIFFGWFPARKAAKLNPIEALRFE